MKKYFVIIVLLLIAVLPATTVHAGTTELVTITYYGVVVDAPSDFTVYKITDTEVGFDWTLPAEADWIHITGKYGSPPESFNDGHTVYEGAGNTTTDVSVMLDEQIPVLYFKAYSRRASDGVWGDRYAEGSIGGDIMSQLTELLLIILILAITLWRAPKLGWEGAFLYLMSGGVAVAYGLAWADPSDTTLLIEGGIVVGVGIFFFYLALIKVVRRGGHDAD